MGGRPLKESLIGRRFGKLVVTGYRKVAPVSLWICACDCGAETEVRGSKLKSGVTASCGCGRIKHGMSGSSEQCSWDSMIQRCENPNNISCRNYGAAGVTVCERWHDFSNFLSDMGQKPMDGNRYTLDRIDGTRGYEPGNCRWATNTEQYENTVYRERDESTGRFRRKVT